MLQNTNFKIFLLTTCCIGLLFSCEKDSDVELQTIDLIPDPTEKVYSTIHGIVLDEQAQIVESAQVTITDQSVETDENGFFKVTGFFPLEGTPISVSKQGFFEANGIFFPQADDITKLNIVLVEKTETVATETGRIIHHAEEHASVLFPKNVFVHEDGSTYNGLVSIDMQYFDPTTELFSNTYPGVLKSRDLLHSQVLFPFGMLKVGAQDNHTRALFLEEAVELTMEVPAALLPFAPVEIPLWYLDKETGLWIQEGTAQLQDNNYVGMVTHLTDWVCALGLDYVWLTGQITKEQSPFPYADLGISYRIGSRFKFRSDENGHFSFPIIIGGEQYNANYFETIDLDVRSNCGRILFEEKNIPPPMEDFSRNIEVKSSTVFAISGQVFCTYPDSLLSTAYVLIQFNDNQHQEIVPVNEQGQFELLIEECGVSAVSIIGYDAVHLQRSESVQVNTSNNNIALNICEAPFEPKVTFTIDGDDPYIIHNCTVEKIDSINYWHYQFTATDTFPAFPEAIGQSNEYTINVFQSKAEEEEEIPAQLWRYTQPQSSQHDVPYSIAFGTWSFDILSETEERIIIQIPLGENVPGNHGVIFKNGSEIIDVLQGYALLEASF